MCPFPPFKRKLSSYSWMLFIYDSLVSEEFKDSFLDVFISVYSPLSLIHYLFRCFIQTFIIYVDTCLCLVIFVLGANKQHTRKTDHTLSVYVQVCSQLRLRVTWLRCFLGESLMLKPGSFFLGWSFVKEESTDFCLKRENWILLFRELSGGRELGVLPLV